MIGKQNIYPCLKHGFRHNVSGVLKHCDVSKNEHLSSNKFQGRSMHFQFPKAEGMLYFSRYISLLLFQTGYGGGGEL